MLFVFLLNRMSKSISRCTITTHFPHMQAFVGKNELCSHKISFFGEGLLFARYWIPPSPSNPSRPYSANNLAQSKGCAFIFVQISVFRLKIKKKICICEKNVVSLQAEMKNE